MHRDAPRPWIAPEGAATLRAQARRFALRFACEDCIHFDAARALCAHGYPTDEHRAERLEQDAFVFCKEFEFA
jgi:hypothetical protein